MFIMLIMNYVDNVYNELCYFYTTYCGHLKSLHTEVVEKQMFPHSMTCPCVLLG